MSEDIKIERLPASKEYEVIFQAFHYAKPIQALPDLSQTEKHLLRLLQKIGESGIIDYVISDDWEEAGEISDQIYYNQLIRDANPDAWFSLYKKALKLKEEQKK